MAGVVAYWAEGTKNKPWRSGAKVRFSNSDPSFIGLFIRWLHLVGVTDDRIYFRLQIHESAEVGEALEFWRGALDVHTSRFLNTILKTHNPKTVRRNIGDEYHGCLCIEVRRSTVLNLQIEGWCQGLAEASKGPPGSR